MATNIRIEDVDIALPNNIDERRVEILVDGLLAVGTTPRPLEAAHRVKGFPLRSPWPCMLGAEVGGRWSRKRCISCDILPGPKFVKDQCPARGCVVGRACLLVAQRKRSGCPCWTDGARRHDVRDLTLSLSCPTILSQKKRTEWAQQNFGTVHCVCSLEGSWIAVRVQDGTRGFLHEQSSAN